MGQIVHLTVPARPVPPVAKVLDLESERRRVRKEGRMRVAFDRAYREVRAAFPDVDVTKEPGAFSALLALTLEQLIGNPDFEGELG